MLERCIFCGGEITELPIIKDNGIYCFWHAKCKEDPFSNRTENDLIRRDLLDDP